MFEKSRQLCITDLSWIEKNLISQRNAPNIINTTLSPGTRKTLDDRSLFILRETIKPSFVFVFLILAFVLSQSRAGVKGIFSICWKIGEEVSDLLKKRFLKKQRVQNMENKTEQHHQRAVEGFQHSSWYQRY